MCVRNNNQATNQKPAVSIYLITRARKVSTRERDISSVSINKQNIFLLNPQVSPISVSLLSLSHSLCNSRVQSSEALVYAISSAYTHIQNPRWLAVYINRLTDVKPTRPNDIYIGAYDAHDFIARRAQTSWSSSGFRMFVVCARSRALFKQDLDQCQPELVKQNDVTQLAHQNKNNFFSLSLSLSHSL